MVEVGDDVFDVFDADGKADEAFGDADAIADVGGHGGVGHRSGKRNKSFDSAEAFGERAKLYLIEEAARGVERFEIEGEHGAGAALLFAGEFVLRVGVQAGVVNLFYFGCASRWRATEMPLALCWSMRTASVLMPREIRKQSIGARPAPAERWMK